MFFPPDCSSSHATQQLGHRRTRSYTPRTNGKAERFVCTMLREWAYGAAFPSSAHRTRALERWLRYPIGTVVIADSAEPHR
jgi:transposase InsO family protein